MAAIDMLDSFLDRPHPGDTEPTPYDNYAHVLGHAMMRGEIDATEAYRALKDFEEWESLGCPKFTTLNGPWIFK